MNAKSETDAGPQVRARVMTGVLIGTVAITWAIAATLVWLIDPTIAPSPEVPAFALAVASAVSGLVLLVGVLVNWLAPQRPAGRAILLTGGLMVAMSGAMLANDSLESGWSGFAAVFGLGCGLLQLVVGLLAWVASLSDWLPGQSGGGRASIQVSSGAHP